MPSRRSPGRSLLPAPLLLIAVLASLFVADAGAQQPATVRITASLDPASITIEPGESVTWTNADADRHRMRSHSGPAEFDTGNLEPGESATITFTDPGTYQYADHRDPDDHEHRGTVVVADSGTPTPPSDGPPPAATDATVMMAGRVFRPATVQIAAGGTVTFRNDDDRAHTATATDRSWDSGIFDTGESYRRTFPAPGSYPYFCVIHPDMRATVVVGDAGATDPPPPTTSPPTTTTSSPPPSGRAVPSVAIVDFDYSPRTITVATGGTVAWRNDGEAPHTVTADASTFDSGFMLTGATFSRAFPTPGTFAYFCSLHPEMRGTVVVGSGTGSSEATAPPPAVAPGTAPGQAVAVPSGGSDVAMLDNRFGPASITVRAGATVRWRNDGAAVHTVTANDRTFDSGLTSPGSRFTRRFSQPGTFGYFCVVHPGMTGTVVVLDASGSAPPPAPGSAALPSEEAERLDAGGEPVAAAPGQARVDMVDLAYEPRDLVVAPGTEVTWVNVGLAPHTVTAVDTSVDSGLVMPGETYSQRFEDVGTFAYYCTLHPGMEGTVTVADDAVPPDSGPEASSGGAGRASIGAAAQPLDAAADESNGFGLGEALALIATAAFILGGWGAAIRLVPGRATPGPAPAQGT